MDFWQVGAGTGCLVTWCLFRCVATTGCVDYLRGAPPRRPKISGTRLRDTAVSEVDNDPFGRRVVSRSAEFRRTGRTGPRVRMMYFPGKLLARETGGRPPRAVWVRWCNRQAKVDLSVRRDQDTEPCGGRPPDSGPHPGG